MHKQLEKPFECVAKCTRSTDGSVGNQGTLDSALFVSFISSSKGENFVCELKFIYSCT